MQLLTEENDRIVALREQGQLGVREVFSGTSVAPDDMTLPV